MNSNYVAEIQSTCCPDEQLVVRQHVAVNVDGNMLSWCKRGFIVCYYYYYYYYYYYKE